MQFSKLGSQWEYVFNPKKTENLFEYDADSNIKTQIFWIAVQKY